MRRKHLIDSPTSQSSCEIAACHRPPILSLSLGYGSRGTKQPLPPLPAPVQNERDDISIYSQPKPLIELFTMDEESFYEEVAKELGSSDLKPGLWIRAIAESNGSDDLAPGLYIRFRVEQLVKAKEAVLREIQRLEDERTKAEEKARLQAAKLEAAELERKEKEAEAELESDRKSNGGCRN